MGQGLQSRGRVRPFIRSAKPSWTINTGELFITLKQGSYVTVILMMTFGWSKTNKSLFRGVVVRPGVHQGLNYESSQHPFLTRRAATSAWAVSKGSAQQNSTKHSNCISGIMSSVTRVKGHPANAGIYRSELLTSLTPRRGQQFRRRVLRGAA